MNNGRIGLIACGIIVAFTAAGCGASSTSGNSGAAGGSTATAAASSANTPPAWAKSLGPGVTVTDSSSAKAGDGSPAGVLLTEMKDIQSGHFVETCSLVEPSQQGSCKSEMGSVPAASLKADMPTFKNIAVAYTAIDGDKALMGITGSVCMANATPKCSTGTDAAAVAIFDSGKSFATLWSEAVKSGTSDSSAYALAPVIKINGVWYAYSSSF